MNPVTKYLKRMWRHRRPGCGLREWARRAARREVWCTPMERVAARTWLHTKGMEA